MGVLSRKISLAKWHSEDLTIGEIPADALTSDLRTTGNTLSFWRCISGEDSELRKVVTALAAAADRVDRMDLAWFDEMEIERKRIESADSPGRTPIESLRSSHVDLTHLDVKRLGNVAGLVADAIGRGDYLRITRKQVLGIVIEAVRDRLLVLDDLQPRVREQVEKLMNPSV